MSDNYGFRLCKMSIVALLLLSFGFFLPSGLRGAVDDSTDSPKKVEPKVRYRAGKQINFDNQLVEGGLKHPSISVVTGDEKEIDNGLLKLREDFLDRVAVDCAEDMPAPGRGARSGGGKP